MPAVTRHGGVLLGALPIQSTVPTAVAKSWFQMVSQFPMVFVAVMMRAKLADFLRIQRSKANRKKANGRVDPEGEKNSKCGTSARLRRRATLRGGALQFTTAQAL
jgi:hypothetical protein